MHTIAINIIFVAVICIFLSVHFRKHWYVCALFIAVVCACGLMWLLPVNVLKQVPVLTIADSGDVAVDKSLPMKVTATTSPLTKQEFYMTKGVSVEELTEWLSDQVGVVEVTVMQGDTLVYSQLIGSVAQVGAETEAKQIVSSYNNWQSTGKLRSETVRVAIKMGVIELYINR